MSVKSDIASTRRHIADVIYEAAARAASSKAIESHLDDLPALSLYTFVTSILTLGNRVVKLGKFELGISEFMSWQRPAMTLTLLFAYTLICYHPQLIVMLPLFYFVGFVLVPNYAEKFKLELADAEKIAAEGSVTGDLDSSALPLSAAAKEKEEQARNRSLLVAVRQGQKALSNVVRMLDKFDEFRNGPMKFEDVRVSCIMLLGATIALATGTYLLSFVSIPVFFTALGWGLVCSKHPLAKLTSEKLENLHIEPKIDVEMLRAKFHAFCENSVLVDEEPLSLTLEIFELCPRGLTARQWDDTRTIFSTSPYLLGSSTRSQKQYPHGSNDLSEVLPPKGWYFDIAEEWSVDEEPMQWIASGHFEDALLRNKIVVNEPWVLDQSSEGAFEDDKKVWKRRRLTRKCYYDID